VRHCGCKSRTFIQLYKPFLKVFSKYFLTNWFFDIYKQLFCGFVILVYGFLAIWTVLARFGIGLVLRTLQKVADQQRLTLTNHQ